MTQALFNIPILAFSFTVLKYIDIQLPSTATPLGTHMPSSLPTILVVITLCLYAQI